MPVNYCQDLEQASQAFGLITLVGRNFQDEPILQARLPNAAETHPTQPIVLIANRNSAPATPQFLFGLPLLARDHPFSSEAMERDQHNYRDPAIERIIKKWLLLSSPTLLSIHLQINGDWHGYIPSVILPLFLQENHRWASVKMEINGHIPVDLPTIRLQCVPTLTSLSLSLWRQTLPAACVDLSCCVIDNAPGLEELMLDTGNFDDLLGMLSACHNLEELEIYIPGRSSFTSTSARESINLPRLTRLGLNMSSRLTTNYLLNNLTCTSLRKLQFSIYYSLEIESLEMCASMEPLRVKNLLTRSSSNPPLEEMILDWRESVPPASSDLAESLKDLLLSLEKLDTLGLHDYALTQEIVEILTIPSKGSLGSRLLPLLSTIRMTKALNYDLAEDAVEEMLVSRWQAGSLRSIYIGLPHFKEFNKRMRVHYLYADFGIMRGKCNMIIRVKEDTASIPLESTHKKVNSRFVFADGTNNEIQPVPPLHKEIV
ncbi:hypothetical protein SCHPADRAFT_957500 [Schizopora paradoxa]|uniref:RNI-like protein n=1 Tax=Schizopora paradoxa TaxID=27342 RepID=A0A0H2SK61_9AGAM|nr:hypothetical protein SCHPADRAFT_957500 [Schizopora paradoxa]